jgi:hypothetical protein
MVYSVIILNWKLYKTKDALLSYYNITNYHKLSSLKPYLFSYSSVDQKSLLGSLLRVSEAEIKLSAGLSSHLRILFTSMENAYD